MNGISKQLSTSLTESNFYHQLMEFSDHLNTSLNAFSGNLNVNIGNQSINQSFICQWVQYMKIKTMSMQLARHTRLI